MELLNAFLPCGGVWRARSCRPVFVRPILFFIGAFIVTAEIEDIALGYSDVLENLPRAAFRPGRHNAPMFGLEPAHDLVKALVSLAAFEKSDKMIAEGFFLIHGYS